ncbi:phytochelatin synthase, partial [Micromonospora luteifusca]
ADSADPNTAAYQITAEHLADWIATRGYATN